MQSVMKTVFAVFGCAALLVAVHSAASGPAAPRPSQSAAAPSDPAEVAVPSQAAPFKWSDVFDRREVEQIPQAEQERLALEFLRAFHPMRLQQIESMKAREPAEYYEVLRGALERRIEAERARLENPQEFEVHLKMLQLDARCEQLALLYRDAPPDKRPAIEKQLEELMKQAFEARQAQMERHLKNLEREYRRLKTIVEKRSKYKDRVIDIHMLRLLGEADVFEMW